MSKSRPKGGRPGGRKGGAGVGPGPGYKPSSTGGGTRHIPGSSTSGCAILALLMMAVPVAVLAAAVWGLGAWLS